MDACGYLEYHVPGQPVVNFAYCGRLPENLTQLWGYPEFEDRIRQHLTETICGKDLPALGNLVIVDCLKNSGGQICILKEKINATPQNLLNAAAIVSNLPKYGIVTISRAAGTTGILVSRVRSLVSVVHSDHGGLNFEKLFPSLIWEANGETLDSFQTAILTHGRSSSDHLIISLIGTY